jgi:hypothetical protein
MSFKQTACIREHLSVWKTMAVITLEIHLGNHVAIPSDTVSNREDGAEIVKQRPSKISFVFLFIKQIRIAAKIWVGQPRNRRSILIRGYRFLSFPQL